MANGDLDFTALSRALTSGGDDARTDASNQVATAAEAGTDISAALPALYAAAGDALEAVQSNAISALACVGDGGGQVAPAGPALVKALSAAAQDIRANAAWCLQYVLRERDLDGAAAALVALLADAKSVGNARAALEAALAGNAARASAVRALDAAKDSGSVTDALRSTVALVRSLDQAQRGEWSEIATRFLTHPGPLRHGVLRAMREAFVAGVWDAAVLPVLVLALSDGEENVRYAACNALVEAGEHGRDITPALAALAVAMADPIERVCKEALWAVYTMARQGRAITPALEAMQARAKDPATHGNALIALMLVELNEGRVEAALAGLDADDREHNFAAAYAITDFAMRTRDGALLTKLLWKLPVGIVNMALGNGVAGAILAAIKRQDANGPFVTETIDALIASTDDPLKQAPLFGVITRVNERLRG